MNSGGAVFAGDQSTVRIEGRISSNAALDDGGGVASFQAAILILGSGCIVQQNSAGNRAGGIFIGGSGALIGELLKRGVEICFVSFCSWGPNPHSKWAALQMEECKSKETEQLAREEEFMPRRP